MKMCNHKALLLNASNMDGFPVYSYAFIQVPAVARQSGIEVICTDLLEMPQGSWEQTIQTLIKQHNPTMILITLRNTDSLNAQDYEPDGSKPYRANQIVDRRHSSCVRLEDCSGWIRFFYHAK